MEETYVCSVCKKRGVKLWRPSGTSGPLLCEKCARERKTSEGETVDNSLNFHLNIKDIDDWFTEDSVLFVPAVQDRCAFGSFFWSHDCIPKKLMKMWEELPTE